MRPTNPILWLVIGAFACLASACVTPTGTKLDVVTLFGAEASQWPDASEARFEAGRQILSSGEGDAEAGLDLVTAAAADGHTEAFGLLLALHSRTSRDWFRAGEVELPLAEAVLFQAQAIEAWPKELDRPVVRDDRLLLIDETRASRGDGYAKTRLATRYETGRGVPQDPTRAFKLWLEAAKGKPTPRSCVYQAPVGDGLGTTHCFDDGLPVPALAPAMLEVCRAYATGRGVTQSRDRAEAWCARATKASPELGEAAAEILQGGSAP